MQTRFFTVADAGAGERLDKWLSRQASDLSRSRIQSLIAASRLTRDGHLVTNASTKILAGQCYRLDIPPAEQSQLKPWDLPLDILFEDADLLVINKPAGLTVHPAAGHAQDTLVNALLAYCGDTLSGIGGIVRPGIVHRLDKDTSGAMLVAKNDAAHHHLSAQLKDRSLSRCYHALTYGAPRPAFGTIEGAIGRSPVNRKKMAVVTSGKPSRTHYATLAIYGDRTLSLVECRLESGRTHQIRVHLTHLGHPLVGDPLYGRKRTLGHVELTSIVADCRRQMLHARQITFRHPATDASMVFEADYPHDFAVTLSALRRIAD